MKKAMKRITALAAVMLAGIILAACGSSGSETGNQDGQAGTQEAAASSAGGFEKAADGSTKLSFKSAASYEDLKALDGTEVTINGYMATSSPADGSFLFLMNLPYQSCPFCKPNTSQLSNTMEVYPKDNKSFDYTTQAISVKGTLEVAESEDECFTDQYGYEFNFKIVDADYTIMKDEELTEEMALWQQLANSDVISEIYSMYDYTNFLCSWPTYRVNSYTDEDGNTVPGFYLYATDAEKFIFEDGAQYNYGYQEGYFDDLIKKIESIDPDAFEELEACVKDSEKLAEKALKELEDGNYTSEMQDLEEFGTEDFVFKLDKGEELESEWERTYYRFTDWLGTWEM